MSLSQMQHIFFAIKPPSICQILIPIWTDTRSLRIHRVKNAPLTRLVRGVETRYHPVSAARRRTALCGLMGQGCNGTSVPPYWVGSGEKLREQSFTEHPHRLTAAAGSLKAGNSVFLPFNVVNGTILCAPGHFVKRDMQKSLFYPISRSSSCTDTSKRPARASG